MLEELLMPRSARILSKGLEAAALRHQVLANNIANVDTPGFKRSDVVFSSELKKAIQQLERAAPGRPARAGGLDPLAQLNPRIVQERNTTFRTDGNNVDIDAEMARLAQNTIWYNSMVQQLSTKLSILRSVISEGRR
jgi:flagellar basal-body rod protein FlgB